MAPIAIHEPVSGPLPARPKFQFATRSPRTMRKPQSTEPSRLDASKLVFIRNEAPKKVPLPDSPEVWAKNACTDHMITCKWTSTQGWQRPKLEPYGPFSIMPTASVLHYATECFEGLKLYRGFDGRLRLFRPSCNTQRMVQSAQRIALPTFDPNEFQKLIEKLCAVDGPKWLPASRPGTFLYLRPTMIGTADSLGVQKPNEALLYVVAVCCPQTEGLSSPAPQPQSPSQREVLKKTTSGPGLKLLASGEDTIRAWPGGFGFAKVGSNYGPSLMAQAQATAKGLDQVLWLFGKERLVTEAGACNFFVVWRTKEGQLQLITAPLDTKVILDGVTRRSVLELAKKGLSASREKRTGRTAAFDSLEVVEREFSMGEIESAVEENRLEEAFVVGTAIFLAPVSRIHVDGKDLDIPMSEGASGKYARLFRTWLWDIMCGAETHEWGMIIREED